MKELSIEEKAQRYDEAIKRAKELLEVGLKDTRDKRVVLSFFPELKESEDEKMKKYIKQSLENLMFNKGSQADIERNNAIAWLEKQGKMDMEFYKVAEDEKREFVGDGFINCYADFQDFKERETYWLEYVGNDNYNVRSDNLLGKTYHITPCQLYTVFKKQTWLEKQSKQKPWSEEDEKMKDAIYSCVDLHYDGLAKTSLLIWLKSLKDRVQPQQEWSEEDDQYLLVCKNALAKYQTTDKWDTGIISRWLENKLKSLRPQPTWRPSDGEMKALEFCLEHNIDKDGVFGSKVVKLFEKLKKLTK